MAEEETVAMEIFAHFFVLFLLSAVRLCLGSVGDRSIAHQECLKECHQTTCKDKTEPSGLLRNPKFNLLAWDCESECEYNCMWKTVELFQTHGMNVPQFHGKWPFVRAGGVQEPASMFFSLLNAAAHVFSIIQFRRLVASVAPMYWTWHGYFLVAMNAWLWSSVFHTRDFTFTQHMDYISAAGLVTYQLFAVFARVLIDKPRAYLVTAALLVASLFLHHSYYMLFVHFDYGYHVKVNVIIGVLNALGWIAWCVSVWSTQPYVWKACAALILVFFCLMLELLDFAPIAWVLDAHSLWHAGTAPLTFVWYSFIIDDCNHMVKSGAMR